MKLDVDYQLTGCVNNAPLEVTGKGIADFSFGIYEMSLSLPRVPMHWDPAFVILICCDRMMGVCAKQEKNALNIHSLSGGNHTLAWRQAGIYDEGGREVGYASASSHGRKEGNTLFSRSQLLTGHIHLGLLEKVIRIATPFTATMMKFGPDMVLITSAYSFETDQGNKYKGYTVYPYRMADKKTIDGPQLLTIESVDFERKPSGESRDSETFNFTIQSKVSELAVA